MDDRVFQYVLHSLSLPEISKAVGVFISSKEGAIADVKEATGVSLSEARQKLGAACFKAVKHAVEKERSAEEKETTPARNRPEVPECPICFHEMVPPVRIFQCRDGHLVCETCKDGLEPCICPECRQEVTGRAIGVERLLRSLRLD